MLRFFALFMVLVYFAQAAAAEDEKDWQYTLIDASKNINVGEFSLTSQDLGIETDKPFSVTMKTLHGGKQEGVQLLTIDNGITTISLIPTRGMSIYEVKSGDVRLGWNSPVKEMVHPQYINLDSRGGLGWLDGFNEWMVRCGIEYAGHPGTDEFTTNTGDTGKMDLTLHGKIGNIPASLVTVAIEKKPPHRIVVQGTLHERLFFGPKLQLVAELSTVPESLEMRIHDTVTNLGSGDQEMQLIYHTNFGPSLLEADAGVVAPVKSIAPMNDHAAKSLKTWSRYQKPTPGFIEEVYLITPYANEMGKTGVILHNSKLDRACSLHWNIAELPYLTIWKNTVAEEDGYVTGLEPATGFPYNRKVERAAQRLPVLKAGESRSFTVDFRIHLDAQSVSTGVEQIQSYQNKRPTEVLSEPPEIAE